MMQPGLYSKMFFKMFSYFSTPSAMKRQSDRIMISMHSFPWNDGQYVF